MPRGRRTSAGANHESELLASARLDDLPRPRSVQSRQRLAPTRPVDAAMPRAELRERARGRADSG